MVVCIIRDLVSERKKDVASVKDGDAQLECHSFVSRSISRNPIGYYTIIVDGIDVIGTLNSACLMASCVVNSQFRLALSERWTRTLIIYIYLFSICFLG